MWLRRLLPWIITGAVLAYLLHQYPLGRIVAEMGRGNGWGLGFAVAAAVVVLVLVAAWDALVMRACVGRLRYLEVLRGKAATSLLVVLGYGFGHGAYGVWLTRRTGADLKTTFGVILYIMLSDLAGVCLVATAAIWLSGASLPGDSREVLGAVAAATAGGLVLIGLGGRHLLRGWVSDRRVLAPWVRVPATIYVVNVLGRGLIICVYVVATWMGANVFGLELPFWAVAVYLPIIMLIGSLPISVGGFGAVQAAWLLFEPWAPGERILAFQFLWHLAGMAGLLVRGLPFLRGVLQEIERGRADAAATAPKPESGDGAAAQRADQRS